MLRMACGMSSVGSGRPFHGSTSCSQPSCFYFHGSGHEWQPDPGTRFQPSLLSLQTLQRREEDHLVRRSVRSRYLFCSAACILPKLRLVHHILPRTNEIDQAFPCYVECTVYALFRRFPHKMSPAFNPPPRASREAAHRSHRHPRRLYRLEHMHTHTLLV